MFERLDKDKVGYLTKEDLLAPMMDEVADEVLDQTFGVEEAKKADDKKPAPQDLSHPKGESQYDEKEKKNFDEDKLEHES